MSIENRIRRSDCIAIINHILMYIKQEEETSINGYNHYLLERIRWSILNEVKARCKEGHWVDQEITCENCTLKKCPYHTEMYYENKKNKKNS